CGVTQMLLPSWREVEFLAHVPRIFRHPFRVTRGVGVLGLDRTNEDPNRGFLSVAQFNERCERLPRYRSRHNKERQCERPERPVDRADDEPEQAEDDVVREDAPDISPDRCWALFVV